MFLGPNWQMDADLGISDCGWNRAIRFDGLSDPTLISAESRAEGRWHCLPDKQAALDRGLDQEPCTLILCRLSPILPYSPESGENILTW